MRTVLELLSVPNLRFLAVDTGSDEPLSCFNNWSGTDDADAARFDSMDP